MISTEKQSMRIAKRLADAGLCSRREAERWIEMGRVAVNGVVLHTPAVVVSESDTIAVDGKPLQSTQAPRLWRYHKPLGLVTTHRDPEGRPTVFASLPPGMPRVVSVGRLDLNSEGLLLLTTSGELAREMEHPSTGLARRYRVRLRGKPKEKDLVHLAAGITIDGVRYRGIQVSVEPNQSGGANYWAEVTLSEGKNREIRRVFEHLGHPVSRLIRVAYGPYELHDLRAGEIAEVKKLITDRGP
jgi:23S rRNA pseudouridine2605 synthase